MKPHYAFCAGPHFPWCPWRCSSLFRSCWLPRPQPTVLPVCVVVYTRRAWDRKQRGEPWLGERENLYQLQNDVVRVAVRQRLNRDGWEGLLEKICGGEEKRLFNSPETKTQIKTKKGRRFELKNNVKATERRQPWTMLHRGGKMGYEDWGRKRGWITDKLLSWLRCLPPWRIQTFMDA